MGNYLSDTWTPAEQLAWRQTWMPTLSGLSLAFSVIALAIFHMFPRMRVFPRSVFSWVGYYNVLWDCYMIWKWSPGSVLAESWSIHLRPGTSACTGGIFLDNFTINGFIACNTLITLTVFLMIILQVEMRNKRIWYWGYILFVWGYPAVLAFTAAFSFQQSQYVPGAPCSVSDPNYNLALRLPGFVLLGIQVILLGSSLIYMRKVYNSVESASNDFPMKYLVVRFTALYIAQLFNILPTEIFVVLPTRLNQSAIYARFNFVTHALGGACDATVMMLGNIDFTNWAKKHLVAVSAKFSKYFPAQQEIPPDESASSTLRTSVSIEMQSPAAIIQNDPADTDQIKLVETGAPSTNTFPN